MSKAYPCVYCTDDQKCTRWSDVALNFCVLGPCKYQSPSHADRIRAMSDEELAADYAWFGVCPPGLYEEDCQNPGECRDCWMEWLKKEADNG